MFVQSVLPQGRLAYEDIRATPESFGGQVGQTLQKTGRILEKNAISRQELLNRVNVNDVYATQFDPAARAIYEEYLTLGGKDAAVGFPAYQQKMQDLAADIREGLPNDMQRMRFDEMARHRTQSNLDAMARHQASQTNQWVGQTADAMAQTLSKRITDERYDFDYVAGAEGLIRSINNLYASYDRVTGQDPAASRLKAGAAIDRGLSDAVLTEAAANPEGAKMLYDRYAPYMTSDDVRQHVLDNLLPAVRQKQSAAVYNDVVTRFNLTDPGSDIKAATSWVMDPDNYKGQVADLSQRNDVAKAIQGEWNRVRQVQKDNQSSADGNFTDAVAGRQIAGLQLQAWKDPKTGLPPSSDILQAAMEHDANSNQPVVSDRDTLARLASDISNRRMNGPGPINQAYLRNLIDNRDFRDLTGLYDTYRDPAKSRWFDYARDAFFARFGDPTPPSTAELESGPGALPPPASNGASAGAMTLFPRYLTDLDQAVREQNLKGMQIRDAADKMLQDLDRTYVGQSFGQMGPAPASQANQPGTAPKSESTLQAGESAASPEDHSRGVPSSVPEQMIRTDRESAPDPAMEWTVNYLSKNHPAWPLTAPNIEAAHDQFKARDPEFWKHWIIKGD
jgi:hypothetical protein